MKLFGLAAAAAVLSASVAAAGDITINDAYARASSAMATSGAAFMEITNSGATDDRLIAASTDGAARVELHTHLEDANGVMRMIEVEDGFAVPAGETIVLKRGGAHVMLMGLTAPLEDGDTLPLKLMFEAAGEMTVDVPVDLKRMPAHGDHSGHGS